MRLLAMGTAVALVTVAAITGTSQRAAGADKAAARTVSITIKATGRDGSPVNVGGEAAAVPLFAAPAGVYRSDSTGVLTVPPGKFLLTVSIYTQPATGTINGSFTLAARVVTATADTTVSFDARRGKPVVLRLDVPDIAGTEAAAGMCYGIEQLATETTSAVVGTNSMFAVPFAYKNLTFSYEAAWLDKAGTWYDAAGLSNAGIPDQLDYPIRVADLAHLVLQARSGTMAGADGWWNLRRETSCAMPSALLAAQPTPVPSQVGLYASAGPWQVRFYPDDHSGQSGTQVNVNLRAGQRFEQVFNGAVSGPTRSVIPWFPGNHKIIVGPEPFFIGSDKDIQCCADGVLTLSRGGHVVQRVKYTDNGGATARVPRPGWYSLDLAVSRVAPPPGVTAPVLSPAVSLTWRFQATAADLRSAAGYLPLTVCTFVPGGLNIANDAPPGTITPLRMTAERWPGGAGLRLTKVRLQVSFDDGATWREATLAAKAGYWLAQVRDPATGYVSLRAIATDAQGDSTVETIYRAYGIG
jgi:hypothetical protein